MSEPKHILVVATADPLEAMRVAAGLTIFGHQVSFLFSQSIEIDEEVEKGVELMALAEIDQIFAMEEFEDCPVVQGSDIAQLWKRADLAMVV
ncbi:MAG: hypothetical protein VW806_08940 [Halieaceae bacterium]|jgi:hypothetical protein